MPERIINKQERFPVSQEFDPLFVDPLRDFLSICKQFESADSLDNFHEALQNKIGKNELVLVRKYTDYCRENGIILPSKDSSTREGIKKYQEIGKKCERINELIAEINGLFLARILTPEQLKRRLRELIFLFTHTVPKEE